MPISHPFFDKAIFTPGLLSPNEKPNGEVELNDDSILRYYKFFEGVGEPIDLVSQMDQGYSESGTVLWGIGADGNQYELGSNTSYFTLSDDDYRTQIGSNFTAWVDLEYVSRNASSRFVFGDVSLTSNDFNWGIYLINSTGRYLAYVKNSSASAQFATGPIAAGRQLIFMTYDGANIRIYSGGLLIGTTAQTGNVQTSSFATSFNRWNSSSSVRSNYHTTGISNRVWSASEIFDFCNDRYQLLKPKSAVILPFPTAAVGAVTTTPITGKLIFKGNTTGLVTTKTALTVSGKLIFKGYSPTVTTAIATTVTTATGKLTFVGKATSIVKIATTVPATGKLIFKGYSPTVTTGATKVATTSAGVITFKGYAPSLTKIVTTAPGAGKLTFVGKTVNAGVFTSVTTNIGKLIFAGNDVVVTTGPWITKAQQTDDWTTITPETDAWTTISQVSDAWTTIDKAR